MKLTDKRLAEKIGITPRAILDMKKNHPDRYRWLRIGILCDELGLNEDDLLKLLENKDAIKPVSEILKKISF